MKIIADGEAYEFTSERLEVLEAMAATEYTGLSLKDFQARLGDLDNLLESSDIVDFKCLQAIVWMARHRAGVRGPIAETNFDLTTLDFEVSDEEIRAAEEAKKAATATAKERRTNPRRAATPTS